MTKKETAAVAAAEEKRPQEAGRRIPWCCSSVAAVVATLLYLAHPVGPATSSAPTCSELSIAAMQVARLHPATLFPPLSPRDPTPACTSLTSLPSLIFFPLLSSSLPLLISVASVASRLSFLSRLSHLVSRRSPLPSLTQTLIHVLGPPACKSTQRRGNGATAKGPGLVHRNTGPLTFHCHLTTISLSSHCHLTFLSLTFYWPFTALFHCPFH